MSISEQAVKHFGSRHQINKAIEELSELIRALSRYQNDDNKMNKLQVEEEMADCEFMLDQLRCIFNGTNIYYTRKEKEKRLDEVLRNI